MSRLFVGCVPSAWHYCILNVILVVHRDRANVVSVGKIVLIHHFLFKRS